MTKNIFVVLGVARSGTSAIARALQALGVDLGQHLVPTDVKWNAKGFFEDSDIVYKINAKAFQDLNLAPYSIEIMDSIAQKTYCSQTTQQAAVDLLKERFKNTDYWGFKDPSTAKLLPFWQSVFNAANLNENYLICLRNPLSSAKSYQQLTGCSREIGLLLWLMHMYPAVANTYNKKCLIVSYESLLQHPQASLDRMQNFFQLDKLTNPEERDHYIYQFLDSGLQHNLSTREELVADSAVNVVPLCVQLYDLLLQLANDELGFNEPSFYAQWQQIESQLHQIYPTYSYLDLVLKENHRLKRQLHAIHKTWVWQLYSPIKKVYDQLRSNKRKIRSEKRLAKAYG